MAPELLTIGHSSHRPEHFSELLDRAGVEVLVDVRSWPHSRYAEWADREQLARLLEGQGRGYVFLGGELGGRPPARSATTTPVTCSTGRLPARPPSGRASRGCATRSMLTRWR